MSIHSQWRRAAFAASIAVITTVFGLAATEALAQGTTAPKSGGAGPATAAPAAAAAPAQSNTDWLIGPAVSSPDSPQYSKVTDAITEFKNGNLTRARELLTQVSQDNPQKLPPVEIMIARLLAATGQIQPARAELERGVKANPDDPEAYLLFAENAIADRRVTDAEALLMEAKPLVAKYSANPKRKRNFDIRYNAGMTVVSEARAKWDDAIAFIKDWLKLDDENAAAHSHLGQAMFQKGDSATAKTEFERAVKIDPKSTSPYIALARLYEQAGPKYRDRAKECIDNAVKGNPNDLNVHLAAAQWALVTNQMKEAPIYADTAIKLDGNSLEAKILRGMIARIQGELPVAKKYLDLAVAQSPSNIDASNQLALTLVESTNPAEKKRGLEFATNNANVTTKGNQFNPEVLATLAWALYKNGNKQDAVKVLNQVIQVGQISPDTAFYLATILNDAGKIDDAISILKSALQSEAPFAQRDNTAELLRELTKKKEAMDKGGKGSDAKGTDTGSDAKGSDSKGGK